MIEPAGFNLHKWRADHGDGVESVFLQTRGIYLIHAYVTHEEDYEWDDVELIDHLIVYNAGTRVLFLYPEVVVLKQEDLEDIGTFVASLREPPYLLRLPVGSCRRWVRRVFVAH